MAKMYVDKIFNLANRPAAVDMLNSIRESFLDAMGHEEWMTPNDRKAAQSKLRQMFFQVAYPTDADGKMYWPSQTEFLDGLLGKDLFSNYMLSVRLSIQHNFKYIDYPPNRRSWGQTPLAINAYYSAKSNGLWIPAGILQAPFFDANHSDAQNFGSIGCILGHEISHGFDDQGRQFDARGEIHNWWDNETTYQFQQHQQCIIQLFDSYTIDGKAVNGNLTVGENIADLGGLKFSYEAFNRGKRRSQLQRQVFFTSFAQTWCADIRRKAREQAILTDEHAPNRYRVIGTLSQFAPFADAFKCPAGMPMAPRPEERCGSLW